jgi:endonuclease-3
MENESGQKVLSGKEKASLILSLLKENYPQAGPALKYKNPFELLVAVILSAQSTDQQVNRITEGLFARYKTPSDFAALTPQELAGEIKSCGLYQNKSRYLIDASRQLLEKHGGRVPETRQELEALPGVGRKTAGVVLGLAFGGSDLPVDTHVFRVARRLGLSQAKTPEQVEQDLSTLIPPQQRMEAHHLFLAHGRGACRARNPQCPACALKGLCLHFSNLKGD